MKQLLRKLLLIYIISFSLVNNVNCKKKPRIIGGQLAPASDFKYVVAILANSKPICGGGIINDRFILTAGHCVFNETSKEFPATKFEIVASTNNSHNRKIGIRIGVEEIYVPQKYPIHLNDADIAVLKLERSLEIKKNPDKLEALKLPNETLNNFENSGPYEVFFAGFGHSKVTKVGIFGRNKYIPLFSGPLRYAKAKIITHTECAAKYPLIDILAHDYICVKIIQDQTEQKYQGICNGDSGSPLVYENVIVGVSSTAALSCSTKVTPAFFTRVSSFVPFIENAMNGVFPEIIVYRPPMN